MIGFEPESMWKTKCSHAIKPVLFFSFLTSELCSKKVRVLFNLQITLIWRCVKVKLDLDAVKLIRDER